MAKLGGSSEWILNTDRIEIYSPLKSVEVRGGRVKIESPLTLRPRVARLANPSRVVVDLPGARLVRRTRTRLDRGVRAIQVEPNVVRLEIETSLEPRLPQAALEPTRRLELDLNLPGDRGDSRSVGPSEGDPASGEPVAIPATPTPKPAPPLPLRAR